ncbi:cell division protein FtsA [Bacillus sp. Marseille-P3661]|uniref:cell division protein FtsA n=1 Tax=Bacillus sp. Marseille-P3661 TaxID=1936234 RepID=UPI000C83B307|nr:cell division protein FtsA [Bacillus sp. Marseille-P3661]
MSGQSPIFALDIGTRSVVGIILEEKEGQYEILDIEWKEHDERAMLDGQIHDVISVSKLILDIKKKLESIYGPLKKVSVAAAGRALKTRSVKVDLPISGKPLINKQDILHLELSAVQEAQIQLASENNSTQSVHYYCVGYSVLRYRLDGEEIGNLVDQQGEVASVEIIATFLPKVVVESLIAALTRADLEMGALTLEPIAAINVLIPTTMRRLNVALVDIGAGTSDIAITDQGTVIAYGMVPMAGDEITEAISDQYLLDFPLAEKAKRELYTESTIKITDILGFETEIQKTEVISSISDSIEKLAVAISDEILTLNNQKSPKAVMLVGGGSLTPDLPKMLAAHLNLPENRIAIRGIDAIQKLKLAEHISNGPELVTPIGIAIAANLSPIHYISVTVNDRPVRLFDMKKITVGDCLLSAGIEMNKLYGKPGAAIIITLNGRDITIPGLHGEPPTLLKEGKNTTLDELVTPGDSITVEKGQDGQAAQIKIKDLIDEPPTKRIWINGLPFNIDLKITKKGKVLSKETILEDHDVIDATYPKNIQELFQFLNHTEGLNSVEPFYIYYNREKTLLTGFGTKIYKNGIEVKPTTSIIDEDKIEIKKGKTPTVKDLLESQGISMLYQIPIIFNEKQLILQKPALDISRNQEQLNEESLLSIGDQINIIPRKVEPFIFQDIFRHVNISIPRFQTGNFKILRNGEETSFNQKLAPGDKLSIHWQQ